MSRQFWAFNGLLILIASLLSCQTTVSKVDLSRDYYNIGNAYSDLGEYVKAAEYFERALVLNPDLNQAAFNLARTNLETENYETALTLLEDLEAEDSENLIVLEMLGYAWYKRGDEEKAGEYYRRSLSINPAHVRSLYNLSLLEKRNKNWGMSRYYLENLLKLEDKKEYRVLIAELAAAEEEYDLALDYYEDLVLEYDGDTVVYGAMKDLYLKTEMYYKALEMLDLLIESEPEDSLLKDYYFEKGNIEILYLDDIILGQDHLIQALDAGYSDKETLDALVSAIDLPYKGEFEKIIKDHLKEEEVQGDDETDSDGEEEEPITEG
ncbi:tetratricopeptide repeat protein [Oceanispirochaeta crateris]|uniref:Tetratricopeptide repeat protein n=1 Tax=Oceanispirochaeta crateris TaxID=2518645 RepID=A0A5C1QL38_9SPIO|nr:tetratricopeptide repeat protein [Oceanispirochaeta crateris]QEN07929.1 tetratricopeptide repeat protein [Oceanispirochaeta crateris]